MQPDSATVPETPLPHLLIVGGTRRARLEAAGADATAFTGVVLSLDARSCPFYQDPPLPPSADPRLLRLDDLERAFPGQQTDGVRLVLTQPLYLIQSWIDRLSPGDRIVATADGEALNRRAPEVMGRRGGWRLFDVRDLGSSGEGPGAEDPPPAGSRVAHISIRKLAAAFEHDSPEERLRLCRQAAAAAPDSPAAALALASAARELNDVIGAREALDCALQLAPRWAAAQYEDGKFWLACDDIPRASAAFARATALMPAFTTAWLNLGATLGELDDQDGARHAFSRALVQDPENPTILNNLGVVSREAGRLAESEVTLRRVTALAPDFAFGHYNLGHTLFLQERYREAVAAYEQGQRLDPSKNRRQACRLALTRFAAGNAAEGERDFWAAAVTAGPGSGRRFWKRPARSSPRCSRPVLSSGNRPDSSSGSRRNRSRAAPRLSSGRRPPCSCRCCRCRSPPRPGRPPRAPGRSVVTATARCSGRRARRGRRPWSGR